MGQRESKLHDNSHSFSGLKLLPSWGCDLELGAEISLLSFELLLSGYFMMAAGKETKTIFK